MTFRKSLLFATLMLAGCGRMSREEEFRSVLPTQELVEMKTPAQGGQALQSEAAVHAQREGETSDFYTFTRNTTVLVNGSTLAVLRLIDTVTKQPPTTVTQETAVWGPHTDALSRNTWKLTVTRASDRTYRYTVEARAKEATDTAFVTVLSGSHTPAMDAAGEPMKGFGQGEFTLDWNTARTLPEHDENVGSMTVKYSRQTETSVITVNAAFRQVKDANDTTKRVDADYLYASTPGQGGEFDFKLSQDWHKVIGSTARENLTIKSRWLETGAGRSDVKLTGGDVQSEHTVTDCWDTTFASRYLRASFYNPEERYGNEATHCVFTSAAYSSL